MLLLVIAGLLFRAWHFRRIFRAELEHARRTGAPEPIYRNPFLGGRIYTREDNGVIVGEGGVEVPTLWDEEMCLEPSLPYTSHPEKSKLGDGTMDQEGGWGKGKAVLRPTSDGSERTLWDDDGGKGKDDWGLDKVQPASLHRFEYVAVPRVRRVPARQPPFSHEMREALLSFVPRKHRDDEEVVAEQPRIRDGDLRAGEEVGVGVLIAMPTEKGWQRENREEDGLEKVGEVSLGVLECRAV